MQLQTTIDIPKAEFEVHPTDRLLFVGSCFADNIGRRFLENAFRADVNPYGVMYNPASVMHTVRKVTEEGKAFDTAVFTLGTNHVYILNETGEIVDNCQKRPQRLFTEQELTVEECKAYLNEAIEALRGANPMVRIIMTVSPIRYQKYGFHRSQLSKATLLLAVDSIMQQDDMQGVSAYFPAYEIMNDELRDYRFWQPDMLHPTEQAVDYIYQRFTETFFSADAMQFAAEWQPIRRALAHRPFNPDAPEHKAFLARTEEARRLFEEKWRIGEWRL